VTTNRAEEGKKGGRAVVHVDVETNDCRVVGRHAGALRPRRNRGRRGQPGGGRTPVRKGADKSRVATQPRPREQQARQVDAVPGIGDDSARTRPQRYERHWPKRAAVEALHLDSLRHGGSHRPTRLHTNAHNSPALTQDHREGGGTVHAPGEGGCAEEAAVRSPVPR